MEYKAAWTVMVYLAGDNNLTDECVYALTEMRKVGSDEQVKIVAQFDPEDDYLPTQRFEIEKEVRFGDLVHDIVDDSSQGGFKTPSKKNIVVGKRRRADASRNDTATGDPETLFNFISWGIERHPAEHYMVVIAGHGSGTERDYLLRDSSPEGYLTIPELKWVFRTIQKEYQDEDGNPLVIDILGMDVCLMSMAEICYELRDLVRITVGCESYSPASGWPYRPILARLGKIAGANSNGGRNPGQRKLVSTDVAKAIVEEYVNFYVDYGLGGLSVHQSALDLSRVQDLKNVVRKLATTLERELIREHEQEKRKRPDEVKTYPFKDALILAHWEAQSYNGELYVDLSDFCNCVGSRYRAGDVPVVCKEVTDFIASPFVLNSRYSGPVYQYSYGVSIYFPWSEVAADYKNLDFAKHSRWAHFLQTYTDHTRRVPRQIAQRPAEPLSPGVPADNNGNASRPLRMVSGKGPDNPIHSMRNPPRPDPVVASPEGRKLAKGQSGNS